jgi:hypothetical protein
MREKRQDALSTILGFDLEIDIGSVTTCYAA